MEDGRNYEFLVPETHLITTQEHIFRISSEFMYENTFLKKYIYFFQNGCQIIKWWHEIVVIFITVLIHLILEIEIN